MVSVNLCDIKVQEKDKQGCFSNFCAKRTDFLKTSSKLLEREKHFADSIQEKLKESV